MTSDGVVLALFRRTPHFLTLPILLSNAAPFTGVCGMAGVDKDGVIARRSSTEELSVGVSVLKRPVSDNGAVGSQALCSASPSSENECLFLYH